VKRENTETAPTHRGETGGINQGIMELFY
jgi:hypothetical protein